jgi:hypothetical protein
VVSDPFEKFRSTVEKFSRRFRRKIERASKQMRTAEAARERAKDEAELAKNEFDAEMARARAELEADLKCARAQWPAMSPEDMMSAVEDLKHAREELRARRAAAPRGARGWRQINPAQEQVERMIERVLKKPPKRRPRRKGYDGGEPVPVEPRPNPKPLMDGAEAPIE